MPPTQKTPEQLAREALHAAAVSVVSEGFEAIDQLGELAKDHLKRFLLRGVSPPRKKK